ncbi:hypothetical protein D3C72_489580 [compost metagenome]
MLYNAGYIQVAKPRIYYRRFGLEALQDIDRLFGMLCFFKSHLLCFFSHLLAQATEHTADIALDNLLYLLHIIQVFVQAL